MITKSGGLYLGQMSGTSLDGLDLALISVADSPSAKASRIPFEIVGVEFVPYTDELSGRLHEIRGRLATGRLRDLRVLEELATGLTRFYWLGIREWLARISLNPAEIAAIGLHGQTVWHDPPVSIQLSDAWRLAEESGAPVVSEFRRSDLIRGGQGAPIMSAIHQRLWGHLPGTTVVVNIGGILNVSVIERGRLTYGFDCGPGNTLIDLWCRLHFSRRYDEDGRMARSGRLHPELLDDLRSFAWLQTPPPRSTDQKYFNAQWLDGYLRRWSALQPLDVLATLTALTAHCLTDSLDLCRIEPIDTMIVCGGGSHNRFLLETIARLLPDTSIGLADDYGYHCDFIEAIGIAWMAWCARVDRPLGIYHLTGARLDGVYGQVCLPPDQAPSG